MYHSMNKRKYTSVCDIDLTSYFKFLLHRSHSHKTHYISKIATRRKCQQKCNCCNDLTVKFVFAFVVFLLRVSASETFAPGFSYIILSMFYMKGS